MAQATAALDSVSKSALRPSYVTIRWKIWIPLAVLMGAMVYVAVIAMNWPFTKQALIDVLQERSLRTVTIGRFYRTYFPPGCTAADIRFLHRKHKEKEPLITVQKLVLLTSYSRILLLQNRLSLVRIMDMHLTVPPSAPGQPNPIMPLTYSKSAASIKIDRIIADGAILEFLSSTGKKPYRLLVDKLRLDGIGDNLPMPYKTIVFNEMPPGKIRSTGVFGTWNPKDPGSTPAQGSYSFENANLAAFHGISGTLFSSGSFKGKLRDLGIQGTASVPNFKVRDASHVRELKVAYRATVNGTNGDMEPKHVTAQFDHTTAEFKGSVKREERAGRDRIAAIDMWTDSGRVEDILRLFISARTAPMSGPFTFSGHVDILPGPQPFLRRLKLNGDFGVMGGKFANTQTELDLRRLSDSSEKHRGHAPEHPSGGVLPELKGHGSAVNGLTTLSNVSFTIPGAKARLHGTYGLLDYKVDLHGTLFTTGSPSDATTGFKSLMVKVITPFFKRNHSAKLVPFKITGSYSKMDTSLDLGRGRK